MAASQQLGLVGTLLISPYAYDYDLTIYGIGLVLLLPDLLRLATQREQRWIFGLSFFIPLWGLASAATQDLPDSYLATSLAGPTLFLSVILIWRILRRDGVMTPNR